MAPKNYRRCINNLRNTCSSSWGDSHWPWPPVRWFICLLLTGIPDALDGAVAKAAGTASVRGAFFDSVSDRVTDSLLFSGIAWHLATEEPGRIMMLPVALMATAMLVSYQRAKAESLGFDAKGGIMERAERFIVLAVGLFR